MTRGAFRLLVAVLVVGNLGLLAVGVALFVAAGTPEKHLIPDGYVGWVSVEYGVPGAPALPVEDGWLVFRYGADGRLETSSSRGPEMARREYFYEKDGDLTLLRRTTFDDTGLIWGQSFGAMTIVEDEGKTVRTVSSRFFVGSKDAYRAAFRSP